VDTGGSTESAEPARVKSVVVSTQHSSEIDLRCLREELRSNLIPDILNGFLSGDAEILVNPLGHFDVGGPEADCGVTGRKLMVDTYGAWARHGGGAFSGKDPSKVDRSGAYFARYAARQVVKRGLAREVEIQVSYAPGVNSPISVSVDSKGSGEDPLILDFLSRYDFSLPAIVDFLKLKRPIYSATTNYGHFGKRGVSWED
jgi:S-adenosylmethionine synthetase